MKKFLNFIILSSVALFFNGCGWGWLVPYNLQPSYHKFKKMCRMQYDFYEKGIGNEESINNYKNKNGFNNINTWYSGRYYLSAPDFSRGKLKWDEFYINCTDFYNKWDKN
ncbi:MAG: hypothetical protein SPJ83_02135 [Helicobacter sp.]|uniref:hypothetical protein n=1 Tax=Helicobacter sp. TaxID=218 RepID=UPI002A9177E0|nr:hypothetical protein [Helicobacter sp.]MDY5821586.1 hypothetical protein [Helicobacter sp.]